MTTLQDQPLTTRTPTQPRAQAGDTAADARQAQQQQSRDARLPADREQSGQQEETFTISADDWFKA